VWTVGHGEGSPDELERRLGDAGVQMIVDVRSRPSDFRTPDFTKRSLELLAAQAGVGYRWLGPVLGEPSDEALGPARVAGDHGLTASEEFAAGIDEIIALARVTRTVVLCSEEAPDLCRRGLVIAPALRDRGVKVVHILGDSSLRLHEPPLPLEDRK
jgi:uncharacterized protein (DUF488 family)